MKRKVVRERRAASGRIPIFFVYLNPKPYFFFFVCVCGGGGGGGFKNYGCLLHW
jgi:hypothetical protein